MVADNRQVCKVADRVVDRQADKPADTPAGNTVEEDKQGVGKLADILALLDKLAQLYCIRCSTGLP